MFEFYLKDSWLNEIIEKNKNIECRAGSLDKFFVHKDKYICIYNEYKKIHIKVLDIKHYKDIYEYLQKEDLNNIAPRLKSYDDILTEYHLLYNDKYIKDRGGICSFKLDVNNIKFR